MLQEESGLDPWECNSMEIKLKLHKMEQVMEPVEDKWRVQYLATLQELQYIGAIEEEEKLSELIDSLCIN